MRNRAIFLGTLVVLACLLAGDPANAATLTVAVGSGQGAAGATVRIPVSVRGAQDLGALQMDLVFDAAVLEAQAVEAGDLLNGLVDSNVVVPGRLRIAMATSQAVNSDGELLVLVFRVLGGGSSALNAELVQAWEQTTSFEMMTAVENGSFTAGGGALTVILLVGGALFLGLLLIVLLLVLRKSMTARAPVATHLHGAAPSPVQQPTTSPQPDVVSQAPALQFLAGERVGQVVILPQRLRVGRAADNDLCLGNTLVSGHHAEVTYENGYWYLKDLGSTNGTFKNGLRVDRTTNLNDGDTIAFGDCPLRICGLGGA